MLCVVGSRLASASNDESIKVWAMRHGPEWPCERTLTGNSGVESLAGWEGKLISGLVDSTIHVWELETGGLDATLTGHRGPVCALLVHGERLFSASRDGSIRAWAMGTWAAVARVEAYDVVASGQHPGCLAASGSKLISGSVGFDLETECEVRVWDVDSLTHKYVVQEPVRLDVGCSCLAVAGWKVWGGFGAKVVVCKGRHPRSGGARPCG